MRRERIPAPKARRRPVRDMTPDGEPVRTANTSERSRRLTRELAELLAEIDDLLLETRKEV